MIRIRPSDERGHRNIGWLDSYFSFSFADYYDPRHMGFRALRVINQDRVEASGGFPMHPHRDMEIITYVTGGALEHKDSMGHGEVIRRGEVQRMSAGTGVTHSEFNPSPEEATTLLQIWILPDREGHQPSYEQTLFSDDDKRNRLRPIATPDGADGSTTIHADARVFASILDAGATARHALAPGRHAWVQVVDGALTMNGQALAAGDGAAVSEEAALDFVASDGAEFLLFDLA